MASNMFKKFFCKARTGLTALAVASSSFAAEADFNQRVEWLRRVDNVYRSHQGAARTDERQQPKLKARKLQELVEHRVRMFDLEAKLLASFWGIAPSASDVQAELDRMARDSRDPTLLRELWKALADDPAAIAAAAKRGWL